MSIQRGNVADKCDHKLFHRCRHRKGLKRILNTDFSKHVPWNIMAEDNSSFQELNTSFIQIMMVQSQR